MSTSKLQIGFIGCGWIAGNHVSRLKQISNVKLVAFSDIDLKKAQMLSFFGGGQIYQDWHDMINKEKLDVVYICIPPYAHSDEITLLAEKGIHVFIEKPIALNLKTAQQMVDAVRKHSIKSQVGYALRFSYAVDRCHQMIKQQELGKVGLATGKFWNHFNIPGWRSDAAKSGGQILEQTTHLLDLMRYLCGEVSRVHAEKGNILLCDPSYKVEDAAAIVLRFISGAVGCLTSTIAGPANLISDWSLVAENYIATSRNQNTLILNSLKDKDQKPLESSGEVDPYLLETQDLIEAIIKDTQTRIPIEEGFHSLELSLAAKTAAYEERTVNLPLSIE